MREQMTIDFTERGTRKLQPLVGDIVKAGEYAEVECPWGDRFKYKGHWHNKEWGGHHFLILRCSVLAVKNGKAVTECVTVNGAIRHIETMERLSAANDLNEPRGK